MMKKVTWLGLGLMMVAAMLLASCSTSTTTTTAAGPVVLTVTNGSTVKTYSLAALQALTSTTGNGGTMGKGGPVTGPFSY